MNTKTDNQRADAGQNREELPHMLSVEMERIAYAHDRQAQDNPELPTVQEREYRRLYLNVCAERDEIKAQATVLAEACSLALNGMDVLIRQLIEITDGKCGEPTTFKPVNKACCAARQALAAWENAKQAEAPTEHDCPECGEHFSTCICPT